jgi:hypothetical protein
MDSQHPPASVPTPTDHYDSAMFSSAMLARCVLTEAQRKSFIQQSAMSIVNDEETGAQVVAYRHPNGKVLIDEIRLPGERENAALVAELGVLREVNRALSASAANDSWSKALQDALDAIPMDCVKSDYWVNGITRLAQDRDALRSVLAELASECQEYEEMLDIVADLEVGEPNGPCAANRAWTIREHLRAALAAHAAGQKAGGA